MKSALRFIKTSAGCLLAMLACHTPAMGEPVTAEIETTWEIHASLTSNAFTKQWSHLVLPDGFIDNVPAGSRISIFGFNNDATQEKDWLVSLRLMEMTDKIWQDLLGTFKGDWGPPGETGIWEIHDADSDLSFVISRDKDQINFTNVAANVAVKVNVADQVSSPNKPLSGKVALAVLPEGALESRFLKSSGLLKFDTTLNDADMVIDVSIGKIKDFDPAQIEAAIMSAAESRLGEQLSTIIPVPQIERVTVDEAEWMNLKFTFSPEQSERVIKLMADRLSKEFLKD
jgi:hypothetical protein